MPKAVFWVVLLLALAALLGPCQPTDTSQVLPPGDSKKVAHQALFKPSPRKLVYPFFPNPGPQPLAQRATNHPIPKVKAVLEPQDLGTSVSLRFQQSIPEVLRFSTLSTNLNLCGGAVFLPDRVGIFFGFDFPVTDWLSLQAGVVTGLALGIGTFATVPAPLGLKAGLGAAWFTTQGKVLPAAVISMRF